MSDNPPAVPRRSASILSKWPHANLVPNSQGQVSLPQGSQIPQVVTPVTRRGSEYPPLPPETRPRKPPRQRAIVTPSDVQLVASPAEGALVAPSLKVEDTGFKNFNQAVQTKVETSCAQVQTNVSLRWDPNEALGFSQSVPAQVQTSCAEVQTSCAEVQTSCAEVQTSCAEVQTSCAEVQTLCAEVQTDFDVQPQRADTIAAAVQPPPAVWPVPFIPSVGAGDSSAASSVGGGQVTSQIPVRIQGSQSSGSTAFRGVDSSSEFSTDANSQHQGRYQVHHHHHHYYHTHSYSYCTITQNNTSLSGGRINEGEEQQYEDN